MQKKKYIVILLGKYMNVSILTSVIITLIRLKHPQL